jgi:hypothetical protein
MARSEEDPRNPATRDTEAQSSSGEQARQGTEAHSNPDSQDRRTIEPQAAQGGYDHQQAAYDRHQGQPMGGYERQQQAGFGQQQAGVQPAEYDDRYSQQGGKPLQGQTAVLGEKDLQPMPNAGTSGASGEFARKPDSERSR